MKLSKKLVVPILIIIVAVIVVSVNFFNTKNPLSGVKDSEIKTVKVFNNRDSKYFKTYNNEGKKILSYAKKIESKATIDPDEIGFIAEEFCASLSIQNPKNYYVEINFTKEVNLKIKDTTIKSDMLVIDTSEKALYYHNSDDYTLKRLNTENVDFSKLEKYLSSNL